MGTEGENTTEGCEAPLLNAHSKAEAEAVYQKITCRIVPFTFLTTVVCYLDRTNISLAVIDMTADIGLTKSQFGVASSLFFATYIIFQIPSNCILERVGGPIWIGTILIGWGLSASMTAFIRNATELYLLRLLLGIFEAGTFPGLLYYLAEFFPETRTPGAFGIMLAGSSFGMAVSAPLAAGLLAMNGVLGLSGWQWLFLLEGLPPVLLGIVIIIVPPKTPTSKGFLTPREQEILRLDRAREETTAAGEPPGLLYLLKSVLLNIPLWVLIICGLFVGTMRYVAIFWTPLWIDAMVNGSGLDWEKGQKTGDPDSGNGVQVALLSAIPYALAAFSSILFGWTSEKFRDRTIHCFVLWLIAGLSFLVLPWLAGVGTTVGFFALLFGHMGISGIWGALYSLCLSCLTKENKSFGLAWTNAVGNVGGLLGPMVCGFLADHTGSYKSAIWGAGGMTIAAAIMVLFVKDASRVQSRSQ